MTDLPPLRLGIAGLGTVGAGLVSLLRENGAAIAERSGRSVVLAGVSARSPAKDRGVDLSGIPWIANACELARSDAIDVYVELIGGEEGPALQSVEAALEAGKHVVTANKALLARHGIYLAGLAEKQGLALNFEAAIAGGIPIVKGLRESLLGNSISRVYGILNGTSNYILTRMQREKLPFDEVLAEAQALGYAEADPTFDIDGQDAGHKLALLAALAFGVRPDFGSIHLEGIRRIEPFDFDAAEELGYRIKLLAVAIQTEEGIEARVSPTMIPKTSALARVDGALNSVAVEGDYAGLIILAGPGAGARATASSVAGDIIDIARDHISPPFILPVSKLRQQTRPGMSSHEGGFYIRLSVYDRPGAIAAIATRMAEQDISLESIVQRRAPTDLPGFGRPGNGAQSTPVVLITHRTREERLRAALDAIVEDGHVSGIPQTIRIEAL
ncbi:homoserine dehydrogenase [Rhodomicrobium sp. Az07]|uniref:homoserine dehydrogenase n=1 Tax=Rhodomicrobium sp. Az07 TaxID=2839034 RepID=UPI001BE8EF82|nr:homoserine dehydrogenase [Rhodomicrobium sp. Az07]MBT3072084.1 homoserine dehydrogenase [Rhodomicrobium sp. Az07]